MEWHIADLAALVLVALCCWQGWNQGFLMRLYTLVRFLLLLVLTIVLVPLLLPILPDTVPGREGVIIVFAMVVAAVILHVVENLLKIMERLPLVSAVNKVGGAALGAVLGVVFVWVILLLIGSFQEAQWCQFLSGYVKQSHLLMELQKFNPLPYIMENFDIPTL